MKQTTVFGILLLICTAYSNAFAQPATIYNQLLKALELAEDRKVNYINIDRFRKEILPGYPVTRSQRIAVLKTWLNRNPKKYIAQLYEHISAIIEAKATSHLAHVLEETEKKEDPLTPDTANLPRPKMTDIPVKIEAFLQQQPIIKLFLDAALSEDALKDFNPIEVNSAAKTWHYTSPRLTKFNEYLHFVSLFAIACAQLTKPQHNFIVPEMLSAKRAKREFGPMYYERITHYYKELKEHIHFALLSSLTRSGPLTALEDLTNFMVSLMKESHMYALKTARVPDASFRIDYDVIDNLMADLEKKTIVKQFFKQFKVAFLNDYFIKIWRTYDLDHRIDHFLNQLETRLAQKLHAVPPPHLLSNRILLLQELENSLKNLTLLLA